MKPSHFAFILLALLLLQSCGASTSAGADVNNIQPMPSEPSVAVQPEKTEPVKTAPSEEPQAAPAAEAVQAEAVIAEPQEAVVDPAHAAEAPKAQDEVVVKADISADEQDIPANIIRCEVKIEQEDTLYQAQAIAPTLEEARDNAVEEACALPCASTIEADSAEDDAEAKLESCTETCTENTIVVAAACHQNGKSIYTEGAWNEDGDAAPTNGEEAPKASK